MSDSKKYPRTYHLNWSPGTTSDDRIAKEEDLKNLFEDEIVITEKLDGENCGMTNRGVYARSHAVFTESPWSREVRLIQAMLSRDIEDNMTLFGENMEGIHSIEYSKLASYFYLFGIRKDDYMLSWKNVEENAFLLDLPTAPVLFKGRVDSVKQLKELTEQLLKNPSTLGEKMEGLVVRISSGFSESEFSKNVFKWVRKGHVQTDEHWTRNWKKAKIINR